VAIAFRKIKLSAINQYLCSRIKSESGGFLIPHLRRLFLLLQTHVLPLVTDLTMAIPFSEALQRLENRRVKSTRPLIPPQILQEDLPLCVFLATLSPADADAVRSGPSVLPRLFLRAERPQSRSFAEWTTGLLLLLGTILVSSIAPST